MVQKIILVALALVALSSAQQFSIMPIRGEYDNRGRDHDDDFRACLGCGNHPGQNNNGGRYNNGRGPAYVEQPRQVFDPPGRGQNQNGHGPAPVHFGRRPGYGNGGYNDNQYMTFGQNRY